MIDRVSVLRVIKLGPISIRTPNRGCPRTRRCPASACLLGFLVVAWVALDVQGAVATLPSNDDFVNAQAITDLPFEQQIDTRDATSEPTDPESCQTPRKTVWYSLSVPETGWIMAQTTGSDYDTVLSVYTGGPGDFDEVACNDDGDLDLTSSLLFHADAGEAYAFMIGSYPGTGGGDLVFAARPSAEPCLGLAPTIVGTPGDDEIQGTSARDVISGEGGNDTLIAGGGLQKDVLCGGEGNDTIHLEEAGYLAAGGPGNDDLFGGSVSQSLDGGLGDDDLRGGAGQDYLLDPEGANRLFGGEGGDLIQPARGTGIASGGGGYDVLSYGGREACGCVWHPLGPVPLIFGVSMNLSTGAILVEEAFAQTIDAFESIAGSPGADTIAGSAESDTIFGDAGADSVSAGGGHDWVQGAGGHDHLAGEGGRDRLLGRGGNDDLAGGAGVDRLDGGGGANANDGGTGTQDYCVRPNSARGAVNCERP